MTELDQTALLCDPFYVLRKPGPRPSQISPLIRPGQLVWAHQVYPSINPYIIEVKGYDPRDPTNDSYVISRLGGTQVANHFPIKELSLRSDENLYVMYGKRRPGVVLQTVNSDFYNYSRPEPYVAIAPCFSFKEKHSEEYRARIAAMDFPNLFFLPANAHGFLHQGVLRFEHIQPVMVAGVEPILRSGNQLCFLSAEAWAILQHRLSSYLVGRGIDEQMEEQIVAYRRCLHEAYQLR